MKKLLISLLIFLFITCNKNYVYIGQIVDFEIIPAYTFIGNDTIILKLDNHKKIKTYDRYIKTGLYVYEDWTGYRFFEKKIKED